MSADELVLECRLCRWLKRRHGRSNGQVQGIVDTEARGDDQSLSHLDTVDASEDVDRMGAESREERDEEVVEKADVDDARTDERTQEGWPSWHDETSASLTGVVDEKHRDRGDDGDGHLEAPADVEDIVAKAKDEGAEEGQQSGEVDGELKGMQASRVNSVS